MRYQVQTKAGRFATIAASSAKAAIGDNKYEWQSLIQWHCSSDDDDTDGDIAHWTHLCSDGECPMYSDLTVGKCECGERIPDNIVFIKSNSRIKRLIRDRRWQGQGEYIPVRDDGTVGDYVNVGAFIASEFGEWQYALDSIPELQPTLIRHCQLRGWKELEKKVRAYEPVVRKEEVMS